MKNSTFLFIGLCICFLSFTACKSSETLTEPATETMNEVSEEKAVNSEAEEQTPEREISLTINGMVKYYFSYDGSSWNGELTQFDNNNPETRKVVRLLDIEPKIGWEDFELMVEYLKIYSLPNQKEIENRKPGAITEISRAYEVSVFNENVDRSYTYFNPEGELTEHWQSRNIATFGTYLINEFKAEE